LPKDHQSYVLETQKSNMLSRSSYSIIAYSLFVSKQLLH